VSGEPPGLVCLLPNPGESVEPSLRTWGRWRPGELRTVTAARGRLVVVGQCLADDEQLRADFHRALDSADPRHVTRWPGSYLAVVLRPGELTAYPDLAGQYPIYYRSAGGRTVVGTHAKATARAAGLAGEPDLLTLAAQVFCPAVPMLTDGRSVLAGLSRVGGGQALRVTPDGRCTKWTYESLAPDPDVSFAEAADRLRGALDDAVRLRAERAPHLTADLSGGLDSTSVAFLAARHRELPVFTYHQPDAPANDLEFAVRYARLDSRLRSEVVHGTSRTLTYQGMDELGPTDLPDPAVAVRLRTRAMLRRVAASGTGVHLGGEGADALLVAAPGYLGDLARHGTLGQLRRDCFTLARARRVSPASVLTRSTRLSRTTVHRALHLLADRLERPVDRSVEWLDAIAWWPRPGTEGGWLSGRMRRELAELARTAEPVAVAGMGVGDFAALCELRTTGAVQRQLDEYGREFGVWPQTPYLDNDVVRACLALPAWRRADDAQVFKPLLGKALTGLVPADVLARRTKGNYSAEDHRGARHASAELRTRIAGLRLAELGVVERAPVLGSLNKAIDGLRAPFAAFNRLLGAELWLAGIE